MFWLFLWLERVIVGTILLLVCAAVALWISPYRLLSVESNSMRPVFSKGDAVLYDRRQLHPPIGSVIAYRNLSGVTITHRLIAKPTASQYRAQGDSIRQPDSDIESFQLQGKVVCVLASVGWLLDAVHTPVGFALWVLVPIVYVLCLEMVGIFRRLELTSYRVRNHGLSTR